VRKEAAHHRAAVIGVDIGGTNIKIALIDPGRKHVLERIYLKTLATRRGPDEVLADVGFHLIDLRRRAEEQRYRVAAVGVGSAGVIDLARGRVLTSPNLPSWVNVRLAEELGRRSQMPVVVENDVNCICYGEYWSGAGRELGDFLGIALGTGVGGCLMVNGRAWAGPGCSAGEVGHMTIDPEGDRCRCGNRGCLETLASVSWLVQRAESRLGRGVQSSLKGQVDLPGGLSAEAIYQAALSGDQLAGELFTLVGGSLGVAIANVVHLLGIRDVLIGGGLANAWDVFIDSLHGELKRRLTLVPLSEVRIVRARLGDDAGTLGAAYLAGREAGLIAVA
jgi:glucokinase